MSAPIRIEQGRAMLLGGCAVTTPSSRGLRRPVARPQRPASPAGQLGEHAYGAICAATDTHCEYLCGVEVAALEVLPPGLGRMRIAPRPTPSSCIRGMSRPCRTPGARPWHGSRNRTINLPSSRISSATAPALTPPPAAAKWKSGSPWCQNRPWPDPWPPGLPRPHHLVTERDQRLPSRARGSLVPGPWCRASSTERTAGQWASTT